MLAALPLQGQETVIAVLKTPGQTFTNAMVVGSSRTHLYVRHGEGITNVKLQDLEPELQKKFDYDPAKVEAIAHVEAARARSFREWVRDQDAGKTTKVENATDENSGTNALTARPGWQAKKYTIQDKGTLILQGRNVWKDSVQQAPAGSPPFLTLRIEREFGSDFMVVICTIPDEDLVREIGLEKVLEQTGNRAVDRSVEQKLDFKPFRGEQATGTYFTLTDASSVNKAPKPGAFKYQSQGLLKVDDVVLSFAICYNYEESPDEKAALEMIKSARLEKK